VKKSKKFYGRLPDGRETTNIDLYLEEWRKLCHPFEELTGLKHYAFDPGVLFTGPDGMVVELPTWVLKLLKEGYERIKNG